jgi:hypothetical protein
MVARAWFAVVALIAAVAVAQDPAEGWLGYAKGTAEVRLCAKVRREGRNVWRSREWSENHVLIMVGFLQLSSRTTCSSGSPETHSQLQGRITYVEAKWRCGDNPARGDAFFSPWFGIETSDNLNLIQPVNPWTGDQWEIYNGACAV